MKEGEMEGGRDGRRVRWKEGEMEGGRALLENRMKKRPPPPERGEGRSMSQCKQNQGWMRVRIELLLNPATAEKLGVKKTTWV